MSTRTFGNTEETIITREEFTLEHAKALLKNEVIAVLGYGVQGPAQALNLRDNGFNVIVGQRTPSESWERAIHDGWLPKNTLFSLETACEKATFLCFLLSDAGQMQQWKKMKPFLTTGKTLLFSHGFSITYADRTGVVPPSDVDVVLEPV